MLYVNLKLAGKHPVIKFSVKKPYLKDKIYVRSIKDDKYLEYEKAGNLNKGDVLDIPYYMKGWDKPEGYRIVVS